MTITKKDNNADKERLTVRLDQKLRPYHLLPFIVLSMVAFLLLGPQPDTALASLPEAYAIVLGGFLFPLAYNFIPIKFNKKNTFINRLMPAVACFTFTMRIFIATGYNVVFLAYIVDYFLRFIETISFTLASRLLCFTLIVLLGFHLLIVGKDIISNDLISSE